MFYFDTFVLEERGDPLSAFQKPMNMLNDEAYLQMNDRYVKQVKHS